MGPVDPTYPFYPIACILAAALLLLVLLTSFGRSARADAAGDERLARAERGPLGGRQAERGRGWVRWGVDDGGEGRGCGQHGPR